MKRNEPFTRAAASSVRGRWPLVQIAALAALAGCVAPVSPLSREQDSLAAEGRAIVQRECAVCHAIDKGSPSPHADAPPLSTLLASYDPDALNEDLIEGVRLGHDDMPLFNFNILAADALVAYLRSIASR